MAANSPTLHSGWRSAHQWKLWLSGLVGSRYDGLTHFAVVEPGVLMRCGQPRVVDLRQIKQQHGLGAVVCARGGTRHPLRGRWFRQERAWCRGAGVELIHLPFSDAAPPPPDVFERFLDVFEQPERRPVLVHCEQGFHRTGILCAAFRIRFSNWSLERAEQELAAHGFEIREDRRAPLLRALRVWAKTPASAKS